MRELTPKGAGKSDGTVINRRSVVLGGIGVGAFSVLASRLYYLQVTRAQDYLTLSDKNRFNYNVVLPSRGRILDRHGEALAINRQDYRVILIPERAKNIDRTLADVAKIIKLSDGTVRRLQRDIRRAEKFIPILIKDNLDWNTFSELNMRMHQLPGIVPEVGEGRAYPNNGIFVHTLGYVGRANENELNADKDILLRQPTFRIGKVGVEASAEKQLRGSGGRLRVEVNAVGRIVREWPNPETRAIEGEDVYLTLDASLQRFAAKQFGEDSGGIAVVDIMTGELRTLLSVPTYDGNLFVSGLTQKDMDKLNGDERRPQYNKTVSGAYAPASTFKMTVMLAALESGLVDPAQPVFCVGKVRLGNRLFHCWNPKGHGALNMKNALKYSCDSYFYEISQIIGIESIAAMARKLGFGQRYEIGVGGEKQGLIPSPKWKQDRMGAKWRMGDTLNASIGQGYVLATPLQLAVMTARIANKRKAVKPNLIAGPNLQEFDPLQINLSHLSFIQRAMWSVSNEAGGTAFVNSDLGIAGTAMASKTGTAQVRGISASERASGIRKNKELPWKLRDHSIFVAFAPFDRPRFAVGCVVEHGGSGAGRAAEISRSVLSEALKRDGLGTQIKSENVTSF